MRVVATLLVALVVLGSAAKLRAPEYDEAYSMFLTAGDARPVWPAGVFEAGNVRGLYRGEASLGKIAHDLRIGDVHPPLYFWTLEYWRRLVGPSWFEARLLSVLFSIGALAALAWLAALTEVPAVSAMLIAMLSYGFAYTGIVARGFALAQLLNILGMVLALSAAKHRKWFLGLGGGFVLGAAGFSNYLAIFVGLAVLCGLLLKRDTRRFCASVTIGFAFWLPWIAYFFLAQRNSRIGQFMAFSPTHAIALLAKDSGAALFGGLPAYAGRAGPIVTFPLALLFAICAGFVIKNWRRGLLLFAIPAIATPIGLLVLGFIFDNTPIEIRYLAFSMPFLALLFAKTLPRGWLYVLLAVEACGTIGLAIAPATMQPQGLAALQLAAISTTATLVLLPFGNDGVGVPGPFIASSPDDLRLQLIRRDTTPNLAHEQHIILATINADEASKQANVQIIGILTADRCWIEKSTTIFYRIFIRSCPDH